MCSGRLVILALCIVTAQSVFADSGFGDPTKPTSLSDPDEDQVQAAAAQGPRWRLQSTLVADNRRLAVINGRTIAQGGQVDGAKLLEVRQDGVTLEQGGQHIIIRLPGAANVKRSGG